MPGALIRTPDQRLRVFVSSTLAELAAERAAVREAIERLRLVPVMFELGARPHPPREVYRAYLEQSQIFVGVYWQRYGWVAPGETVSGLEDEYGLSQGMPRLLYVKAPAPEREPRLEQLLLRVQNDDTASYKPFRTPEELAGLVGGDLALLLSERFASLSRLPTGVVTFLFTDIDGSSGKRESVADDTAHTRADHHDIVRRAITSHRGHVFNVLGDGFCAAFAEPLDAVLAAFDLQRALAELGLPAVRIALHSGTAQVRDGGYLGPPLRRVAQLLAATHGGQVLLSAAVVDLLGDTLPRPLTLRSLGLHRLSDLSRAEEIQQLVMPGLPPDFPPLRTLDRRRHNLPVQLSSFVGREREVADVSRALDEGRLVTLTGVGGAGKSRLALQVAANLVDRFPDAAWLVELAPVTEPERVASAVAGVLAVPEDPHRSIVETLADELGPKRLLLVVDNCEHVLAACAELAATLLQAAPGLHVLATSREGLAVPGEVILPVPSLAVPPQGTDVATLPGFPAARLFAERAKAVRPEFAVTPANAAAVVQIVTRLDGIPLAIELAAARVRMLSVEQIAARLSDRFRLLRGGARTALPRQQTLQAAMDWSYDLLEPAEQMLLRRLSVFMGSWTVEAAETVCCGDGVDALEVLDLLGRLVDESLVLVVEGAEENRYRLLETVRQYGHERLIEAGESAAIRTAHRDWCRLTVEAAAVHVRGGEEQARWLEWLESEHDNIRAALEWSLSVGDATASLRIAVGAAWFWYLHGYWDEADGWLEQSVAAEGAEPGLRARGGAWVAVFAWRRGDLAHAKERAEASLEVLAGSGDEGEGLSLLVLALVEMSRLQFEQADAYGRRALGVFRAQQHTWGVATSLMVLAHVAINRQSGDATPLLQESAALLTSSADKWGRAHVLGMQGSEAFRTLDLDRAQDLDRASHTLAMELGDRAGQAESLLALGHIHLLRGEDQDAARVLVENRSLVEALRDPHQLAHADQALALLAVSRGSIAEGEALLEDTGRRLVELGRAPMGSAYAIGMADIYRRGGWSALAAVLLRHALSLLDESQSPAEYARARQELAALEGAAADAGEGPP